MSCFQGRMREYTSVSVDRFDSQNVASTAFFLSHCHKDHMVGLDWSSFHHRLQSRNDLFLYCSAVTRTLLLADTHYRPLEKYIKVLPVNAPTTVTIPDKGCDVKKTSSVLVTTLPAGHCPGSVMFLFEGKEGTVLYTGDFRWETNHAQNLQAFKSGNCVKEIKSLYIDTTFCFEDAFHFPSRTDCEEASAELVRKWLKQSEDHVVSISCKAKYGYEHFLQEMSARTGEKVHTSRHKCEVYQQIGDLKHVFTADPSARIHACDFRPGRSPLSRLPCGYVPSHNQDLQVLVLRPSTMFFALQHPLLRHNHLVVYPKGPRGLHRVCYSFHSSYVEIRDLVMFLRPQRVFPNVKPPNEEDLSKVQARLNGFLKMVHLNHQPSHVAPSSVLGKLKVRQRVNQVPQWSQSDSEDLVFDSPPLKLKPDTAQETPSKNENSQTDGTPSRSDISVADSSYQGSNIDGEEMDLTKSQEETGLPDPLLSSLGLLVSQDGGGDTAQQNDGSYCLYVSGDEDCEEEDHFSKDIYPDNDNIITIESSLSQDTECCQGGTFDAYVESEINNSGIQDKGDVMVASDSETESKVRDAGEPCCRQGRGGMPGEAYVKWNPDETSEHTKALTLRNNSDTGTVPEVPFDINREKSDVPSAQNQDTEVPFDINREKSNEPSAQNQDTEVPWSDKFEISVLNDKEMEVTCDVKTCDNSSDKSEIIAQNRETDVKTCDTGSDKSYELSAQKNRSIFDKSVSSIQKSDSRDTTKNVERLGVEDCVIIQDNSGPFSVLSKSKTVETDSVSKISSPIAGTTQKEWCRFHKSGSFDLFDEGNVTDVEDNVIDSEEAKASQGFDVDLGSDSDRARRRKYITEIDKEQEVSLRESTAQMLLRLQRGHAPPPPAGEQIVISDSDSDSESGFLSGSKESGVRLLPSNQVRSVRSKKYSGNLSALVSKVEKRLASSDSEFSPRKRLHWDISRNCESDSDVTLPPSQGSYGSRYHTSLYYDSTDSSESDTDSDAVEILYETDPSGAKFDVLGNPLKSDTSLVTVCVKPGDHSPRDHSPGDHSPGDHSPRDHSPREPTTAESSDVIDLTEDNEDEMEEK